MKSLIHNSTFAKCFSLHEKHIFGISTMFSSTTLFFKVLILSFWSFISKDHLILQCQILLGWLSFELLILPSLSQLSSKGYNIWIGRSRYPLDDLIRTVCITWSFTWYAPCMIPIFQVSCFLLFPLIIVTSSLPHWSWISLPCVSYYVVFIKLWDSPFSIFSRPPISLHFATYLCFFTNCLHHLHQGNLRML